MSRTFRAYTYVTISTHIGIPPPTPSHSQDETSISSRQKIYTVTLAQNPDCIDESEAQSDFDQKLENLLTTRILCGDGGISVSVV